MLYRQIVNLPIIFQLDENNIGKIGHYLNRNFLSFQNVAVLSGPDFSYPIAAKICEENHWQHFIISAEANYPAVEDLKTKIQTGRFDLIIGVGGGNIIDIGKRISFLTTINFIAVPTIISNDGLISPISVIKDENGLKQSLPAQMPMGIIIDMDIIRESPKKYLKAAAGDILTNLSATNDWVLAHENNGDKINDIAYHISRNAAYSLIYFGQIDFNFKPFIKQIVQGQIYSGLSMALAGESRPCSGSEHLISHAIDYLKLTENVLHGTQVASISLFSLYLQKKLADEHLYYAEKIETPFFFHKLGTDIENNLPLIFKTSQKMRPGRYTVLDTINEHEFIQEYLNYCSYIGEKLFTGIN